jgi:hypothetical protein
MSWWEGPAPKPRSFERFSKKKKKHTDPWSSGEISSRIILAVGTALILFGSYHFYNVYAACSSEVELSSVKDEFIAQHPACREEYSMFAERLDCEDIIHSIDERTKRAKITSCWWNQVNPFHSYWNVALFAVVLLVLLKIALGYRVGMLKQARKVARERGLLQALQYIPHVDHGGAVPYQNQRRVTIEDVT